MYVVLEPKQPIYFGNKDTYDLFEIYILKLMIWVFILKLVESK